MLFLAIAHNSAILICIFRHISSYLFILYQLHSNLCQLIGCYFFLFSIMHISNYAHCPNTCFFNDMLYNFCINKKEGCIMVYNRQTHCIVLKNIKSNTRPTKLLFQLCAYNGELVILLKQKGDRRKYIVKIYDLIQPYASNNIAARESILFPRK